MDNFYSSPTLFKHLKSEGFEACGTIEVTRRDFPDNLRPHKKALAKAKVERGEGRWMRDGDLVFVMWRDTKVVSVISTMHLATGNDTVERKIKDKDGHLVRKQVPIPPPIVEYNQHMGGVDLSDQLISYYNSLRKTKKYWRTLFLHFIDVMVTNAYILYSRHLPEEERKKVTHKKFREVLVTELCQEKGDPEAQLVSPQQQEKVRAPHQLSFVDRDERGYCDLCRKLKLPRHRTRYKCTPCDMYFCFEPDRNCFRKWHSYKCDHLRISQVS